MTRHYLAKAIFNQIFFRNLKKHI